VKSSEVEPCAVLGYYAANNSNSILTYRSQNVCKKLSLHVAL